MNAIPATLLRQIFLLLLIGLLGGLLFWQLQIFLPAFLGAYTFYVLMRRPLFYLTLDRQWPRKAAAALLMVVSFVVILIPINSIFQILVKRILPALQHSPDILNNVQGIVEGWEKEYDVTILTPETIQKISGWGINEFSNIVSASLNGLLTVLALYFILWFMLSEGQRMEKRFFEWLPLKPENERYIRKELHDLVYSNALGIPLMGLVQGLVGFIAYWLLGIPEPGVWFVVTMLAGMMPLIGVAFAYVPLTLILLSNGQQSTALFVFLYGFIVLGSVDNLARMWLLKKIGNAHPLVTLFGVIAGIQLFGFVGFIFGPIMVALFLLLAKLYEKEFSKHDEGTA